MGSHWHLNFSSVRLMLDVWPTELEDNKSVLLKPLNCGNLLWQKGKVNLEAICLNTGEEK